MRLACLAGPVVLAGQGRRPRARDLGIAPGRYQPGAANAITDVPGVRVGHKTLIVGDDVRTGATAIWPHPGNVFQEKVPAAVFVFNAFGKMLGGAQVEELGVIESPILLTNTLAVWRAADALKRYMLDMPGNEGVRSINVVVGETNDGRLNNIRKDSLTAADFREALEAGRVSAEGAVVEEGAVGAGTGTRCFGYKGGIGTSSRLSSIERTEYRLGVLVQSNFGGDLQIAGVPIGSAARGAAEDGSIMMIVATDAPLDARQLKRVARRATFGLARTGSSGSHGSGDFVIAFSTAREKAPLKDERISPLLAMSIEATEEAIYNSLLQAESMTGYRGYHLDAIDIRRLKQLLAGAR